MDTRTDVGGSAARAQRAHRGTSDRTLFADVRGTSDKVAHRSIISYFGTTDRYPKYTSDIQKWMFFFQYPAIPQEEKWRCLQNALSEQRAKEEEQERRESETPLADVQARFEWIRHQIDETRKRRHKALDEFDAQLHEFEKEKFRLGRHVAEASSNRLAQCRSTLDRALTVAKLSLANPVCILCSDGAAVCFLPCGCHFCVNCMQNPCPRCSNLVVHFEPSSSSSSLSDGEVECPEDTAPSSDECDNDDNDNDDQSFKRQRRK